MEPHAAATALELLANLRVVNVDLVLLGEALRGELLGAVAAHHGLAALVVLLPPSAHMYFLREV